MIIHVLIILFLVVFWNTSVDIACCGSALSLPISLVAFVYMLSIYLIFKAFFFVRKFSGRVFDTQTKVAAAKEKCVSAMFSYVGGDVAYGKSIWQDAEKMLKDDELFILLSIANARYYPEAAYANAEKLGQSGSIIQDAFVNKQREYSKSTMIDLLDKHKMPWAFRGLIHHYLMNSEVAQAEATLKQFWQSGKLSTQEWRQLKALIFMKEAEKTSNSEQKFKLYRKANRLDKSQAVFEMVKYYRKHRDITKARKLIEESWASRPSIKLGKIYVELDEFDIIPIHKFQHVRELAKYNENHPITHLLVATYAMESELWAIAVEYLNKFKEQYPALGSILIARLEFEKSGNGTKVWENIEKAFVLMAKEESLDVDSIV